MAGRRHFAPAVDRGARVLLDWPPGAPAPAHLSLLFRKDSRGRVRDPLIEAEARAAARENANLLYVALTRARQFLFVSGVAPARGSDADSWLARLDQALRGCDGACMTEDGAVRLAIGDADPAVAPPPAEAADARPEVAGVEPVGERRAAAPLNDEQLWGTGLHAWLESLANGEPPPPRPAGLEVARWAELEGIARSLVASDGLQRFFVPALHRWSASEVEFVLPDGSLGRIDRLVEFDDEIWVLDYKSGRSAAHAARYAEQLDQYVRAVSAIRPGKPVRAALIRPDGVLDVVVTGDA